MKKTILIEENASCDEKDNSPKEKRKDYWRMRSDEKVLFFYQKSTNTIHDKHCDITKKILLKDLTALQSYKPNKNNAPTVHCNLIEDLLGQVEEIIEERR